jgi:anti-sigma regulatory factor (Ser/Thr protein kinase)
MQTPQLEMTPMSAVHDVRDGGCAAWQLPFDARSPALARSYFSAVATALALPSTLIDDGTVAVSELATNAHQHAGRHGSYEPVIPPELWIYPRSHPQPQLVVTVFDTRRDRSPLMRPVDPLDEHGKGLGIVTALSADSGSHPSRSRVGAWPIGGKAVWFALALSRPWPTERHALNPAQAAKYLQALLAARGLDGLIRADRPGVSLVSTRTGLTVWAEPREFCLRNIDGTHTRRPLTDLEDVAELVVHHHERDGLTHDQR